MASSLVLVLLVDNLPGIFLNKTVQTIRPFGEKAIEIHKCDQVTQPIVDLVNRNILGQIKEPTDDLDLNSYLKITKHTFQNESPETFQNSLENTIENSKSIENQLIANKYEDPEVFEQEDKSECENTEPKNEVVALIDHVEDAKLEFHKTVPFLVAIFETLQDVTAQTCGGTLLAPHWVLTAAGCVNLLGSMYGNSTNSSSSYTVIANSSDPLSEGSAHNVTQVILHPGGGALPDAVVGLMYVLQGRHQHSTRRSKTPSLALLRVEPAVGLTGAPLEAPGARGAPRGDVAVYGWQLVKNDTTNATSIRSTSILARALSPYECELQYGVTDSSGALCLSTVSGTVASTAQMSSGGPVLWVRGGAPRLAGVVLGDTAPLAAAPVAGHAAWLRGVLQTDDQRDLPSAHGQRDDTGVLTRTGL